MVSFAVDLYMLFTTYWFAKQCLQSLFFFPLALFGPSSHFDAPEYTTRPALHGNDSNLPYYLVLLSTDMDHRIGYMQQLPRQHCQSPSRCLPTPMDSALPFLLGGIPEIQDGFQNAFRLQAIVLYLRYILSALLLIMLWPPWLRMCTVMLSRQIVPFFWLTPS